MGQHIVVQKGRKAVVFVSLGDDVSKETITSEIRSDRDPFSPLIAMWDVSYKTDGKDGEVVLTLDESITTSISDTVGYMGIKRIKGGKPRPAFAEPLEVQFQPQ